MKKVKNLDLIIILVAITILGIITAIVLAIRPYDTKYELLEECVVAYAEFARNNKDVPNIYVIDYRSNKEIINSSNFNINDVKLDSEIPCLAKITTSGSLTNKKKNISDICNLLEDYMSGKEQ